MLKLPDAENAHVTQTPHYHYLQTCFNTPLLFLITGKKRTTQSFSLLQQTHKLLNYTHIKPWTLLCYNSLVYSLVTSARVALAVRSTFASILSRGFPHLHGSKACLLRSHPEHQSLGGCHALGEAHVGVHLASANTKLINYSQKIRNKKLLIINPKSSYPTYARKYPKRNHPTTTAYRPLCAVW